MSGNYLFRGVTHDFLERNGGQLKPKLEGAFEHSFTWSDNLTWRTGATWIPSCTNAVIQHQLDQMGHPTSGISSTPHRERAEVYMRGRSGKSRGYLFVIDRDALAGEGIKQYPVADYCPEPSVPEDAEVVLVTPGSIPLPKSVILDILEFPAMN
jgi:hypothetical protein